MASLMCGWNSYYHADVTTRRRDAALSGLATGTAGRLATKIESETVIISWYDVSDQAARIVARTRDSFDRAGGLCYGNLRMSFVVFPGGEKRFRYWPFVFMQVN